MYYKASIKINIKNVIARSRAANIGHWPQKEFLIGHNAF